MKRGWLGIDAGGSGTRARVVTEAGCTGASEAGPANWTTLGPERCVEALVAAASQALRAADLPAEALAGACVALAGYYPRWHEAEALHSLQAALPAARLRIVPDLRAAWEGATGGDPGIVLIAGTGAVAYGRDAAGREARAGGWGPLFGDEGSGYWIGCEALSAISRSLDGRGPATSLTRELLMWPGSVDALHPKGTPRTSPRIHAEGSGTERSPRPGGTAESRHGMIDQEEITQNSGTAAGRPLGARASRPPDWAGGTPALPGAGRPEPPMPDYFLLIPHAGEAAEDDTQRTAEALRAFYRSGATREHIAALAAGVTRHAAAGDPVAEAILVRAAAELGALVAAVARGLGWGSGPLPISAVGGVVQAGPVLRAPLERWLTSMLPNAVWREPAGSPLDGALRLAREAGPP